MSLKKMLSQKLSNLKTNLSKEENLNEQITILEHHVSFFNGSIQTLKAIDSHEDFIKLVEMAIDFCSTELEVLDKEVALLKALQD